MIDYLSLSNSEQKCYNYLESIGPKCQNLTLFDVCENSGVSTATVNRLLKKLGYDNFKSYKNTFANSATPTSTSYDELLIDLINNFDISKVNSVVEAFDNASRIYFVSFGSSASLSMEATIFLNKIGYKAFCINDDLLLESFLENYITTKDLVFYISYAGNDLKMLKTSSKLQHFCYQILLTANTNSKMISTCNINLNTHLYDVDKYIQSRSSLSIVLLKISNILNTEIDI